MSDSITVVLHIHAIFQIKINNPAKTTQLFQRVIEAHVGLTLFKRFSVSKRPY